MRRYKLTHGPIKVEYAELCGFCDSDKGVTIDRRLRGRLKLDTLIHEVLHLEQPQLSEEDVTRTATAIMTVLWGEGWREKTRSKK